MGFSQHREGLRLYRQHGHCTAFPPVPKPPASPVRTAGPQEEGLTGGVVITTSLVSVLVDFFFKQC